MAFLKYAKAKVVEPDIGGLQWNRVRVASKQKSVTSNLMKSVSGVIGTNFDPNDYLLSHATIVCSVDTEVDQNAKLDGKKVRYNDYFIAPVTEKYVNNNEDAWSRGVLTKSYPTFVGGHNFVEHVQIEEFSKGRILDAVARDVGESIYIDILLATHRKHKTLVQSIKNKKMSTLSMGCSTDFTICSKCGNVAVDEVELCNHIKYEKGNHFFDKDGIKRKIAELCGHESIDPTGGVVFVEASWVENPAFRGAVLRNVVNLSDERLKKVEANLNKIPTKWSVDQTKRKKAAFLVSTEEPKEDEEPTKPKNNENPIDNENINRFAAAKSYKFLIASAVQSNGSSVEVMNRIASIDHYFGVGQPVEIYRAALEAGPITTAADVEPFLKVCQVSMNRSVSRPEAESLVRLGKLIARRS